MMAAATSEAPKMEDCLGYAALVFIAIAMNCWHLTVELLLLSLCSCRLTGSATLLGVGAYFLNEVRHNLVGGIAPWFKC